MTALRGRIALVTGASGFIGSALCVRLRDAGAVVHAVARRRPEGADDGFHTGDLADASTVDAVVEAVRPDVIFHLASHVSGSRDVDTVRPTLASNLVSTVNILVAARRAETGRVIVAGSLEEPGPDEPEPVPVSPYAAGKFGASAYARMFSSLYGLPIVTLRIFMVYGPGQRDETKLLPYVITSLLRGESPRLSSGTRPVDWVYVGDVVDAFLKAAVSDGAVGETVDVGSGSLVSVREIVKEVARRIDPEIDLGFGALPDRPFERVRVADVERTMRFLGWAPKTSLDQGLRDTVAWYAAQAGGPVPSQRSR